MGVLRMKSDSKKDPFEKRGYIFEVRASHDDKHGDFIEGRPIVYESKTDICGWFEETICRGALDHTDLTDVRFLVNHDDSKIPLARSRRNNENSTMQLKVDENGMWIRVNLDTENNMDARALYSAVKRGDISGMSFLFIVKEQKWEDEDTEYPKRFITAISKVVEVSAVNMPAYEDTEIYARSKETLENVKKALENARNKKDSVETDSQERNKVEILKLKNQILGGC